MYLAKGSRKRIDIKIGNASITQVDKIKLLGRIVNSSLTVGEHYNHVLSECSIEINLMRPQSKVV